MPSTAQQTQLACTIDTLAKHVIARGGGDEKAVLSLADHVGTFKPLMDIFIGEEMNAIWQPCYGFYCSAKRMEKQTEGITDGGISVAA